MWTISEIKTRGREAFKGNYWPCVIAGVVLLIAVGGAFASMGHSSYQVSVPQSFYGLSEDARALVAAALLSIASVASIIAVAIKVLVLNPLSVGCAQFFSKNIDDPTTTPGTVFDGFNDYGHAVSTMLLKDVFIALWAMLFIIPGIVKSYSYSMVPYLIKDNPELSATEAITRSRDMMQGNKGRAFLMDLSFIGWYLLGTLTLGLGNIFWTTPYHASTGAALYHELSQN